MTELIASDTAKRGKGFGIRAMRAKSCIGPRMLVRLVLTGAVLVSSTCFAQISPINPPSGWKVPSGGGTCTVGKSCAELAPTMMKSALGASPLEKNVRYLTGTIGGRVTGSREAERTVGWAVEAFRRAGVDEVHSEKFMVAAGGGHAKAVQCENVVAEIRGREKPDEFVVLGAHLDSRDPGTGALDDSSDAALVIDAARVIHSSGSVPRRSIRFVLFTGEKGMPGSRAYLRTHRDELDRTSAAILSDGGIGSVTGYSLAGRKDALKQVREALAPLAPLDVKGFTLDAGMDTNRFDFILEGILTLDPNQKPTNDALHDRAAADTFDKADIAALKRQVGIAAITAYALADASEPIARRQSRAEIERLLEETGLGKEMKIQGFRPALESGEPGRKQ